MYDNDGAEVRTWTCKPSGCTCEGDKCDEYTLTTSIETDKATLMCFTVPNCRYIDTVKYKRNNGGQMGVFEIAIISGISGWNFVLCHCCTFFPSCMCLSRI